VIPEQIIQTQSTEVDAVSGATFSSMGIIHAVKNALSQASQAADAAKTVKTAETPKPASIVQNKTLSNKSETSVHPSITETAAAASPAAKEPSRVYRDGTYQGEAVGFRPGLRVSIRIKDDKIMDVQIISSNDDRKFSQYPFQIIPGQIIARQSADVDAVSGATYTSIGIIDAVKDALRKATVSTGQGV
jgi:uncharacterized protein with FMN-binding domain